MKKKPLFIALIIIFSLIALISVAYFLFVKPMGDNLGEQVLKIITSSNDQDIPINIGDYEISLNNDVKLYELSIGDEENPFIVVDEATLSIGLKDIVKLSKGEFSDNISCSFDGAVININSDLIDLIDSLDSEGSESGILNSLKNTEIAFDIKNSKINLDIEDIKLISESFDLHTDISRGFNLDSLEFDSCSIELELTDYVLHSENTELSYSSDSSLDFTSDVLSVAGIGTLLNTHITADFPLLDSEKVFVEAQSLNGNYAGIDFSIENIQSDLVLGNDFSLKRIESFKSDSLSFVYSDVSVSVNDLIAELNFLPEEQFYASAAATSLNACISDNDYFVDLNDFECSFNSDFDFSYLRGNVYFDSIESELNSTDYVKSIELSKTYLKFDYSEKLNLNFDSDLSISCNYNEFDYFESSISANINQIDVSKIDFNNIYSSLTTCFSSTEISMTDSKVNIIDQSFDADFSISGNDAYLGISISNLVNSEFHYSLDNGFLDSYVSFSGFKPYYFKSLFEHYIPVSCQYFDDETDLSFELYAGIDTKNKFSISDYKINLSCTNLLCYDNSIDFNFSSEDKELSDLIKIDSLNINALGYSLSFVGYFDSQKLLPSGKLVIDSIAEIELGINDTNGRLTFGIVSDYLKGIDLQGEIKSFDSEFVTAIIFIGYETYEMQFDANMNFDSMKVSLSNDKVSAVAGIVDDCLSASVDLKDFEYSISDSDTIVFNGCVDVVYCFKDNEFELKSDCFSAFMEDYFNSDFGFIFTESNLEINNLNFDIFDLDDSVYGNICYNYETPDRLLDVKENSFNVNLSDSNNIELSFDYNAGNINYGFRASIEDNISIESSGYGSVFEEIKSVLKINETIFDLVYSENKINLTSPDNKVSSFDLSDILVGIDIADKSLNGSLKISRLFDRISDDVYQSLNLSFNLSLNEFSVNELFSGEYTPEGNLTISLEDIVLEDGFEVDDIDVYVSFDKNNAVISGDIFNGNVNFVTHNYYLDVNPEFLFSFKASGVYGENVDLVLNDIIFPVTLINQFVDLPFFTAYNGNVTGNLMIIGPIDDLSFYGILDSKEFELGLLWIPDQILTLKSLSISIIDKSIYLAPVSVIGHSSSDGRFYSATYDFEATLSKTKISNIKMNLHVDDKPIDLWLPIVLQENSYLNVRGDVVGDLAICYENKEIKVTADVIANNTDVTFEFPDYTPQWVITSKIKCSAEVKVTTGNNVECYYPNKENYFLNFISEESDVVTFVYDSITGNSSSSGKFNFKSGEIYYIQNSFKITEGELYFSSAPFSNSTVINPTVNLRARLREFDTNGYSNDIYLILSKATFDNINPRFESSTGLSENEIIQLLSQSVGTSDSIMSASSVASIAVAATEAISKLGFINSNSNYSISASIRDSLQLNIFSMRSTILENIIVESLPGQNSNISLLARYLNGTTVFAGKYFGDDIFGKMTVLLKAIDNNSSNSSFISEDLNLDFEFSLDWENTLGAFSIFVKPNELSVVNFIENIGFSYSKVFYF